MAGVPDWVVSLAAQVLLFLLLAGLAASVDVYLVRQRMSNMRGLLMGMACQFLLLPFLGFLSAKAWNLPPAAGVALLAVTSSPGGAYSNWWCSIFNADLALSVVMTMCSTLVSMATTPLNLAMYASLTYGSVPQVQWWRLIFSMFVAVAALGSGMLLSLFFPLRRKVFNIMGNLAGVALITLSVFISSGAEGEPVWDKDAPFYCAVAMPCVSGVIVAFTLSWMSSSLTPPEAVALTVETAYQNTGLALTISLATFTGKDRAIAVGVPLFYQIVQIAMLPIFLVCAWKGGFTYAPKDDSICQVICQDYQPCYVEVVEITELEDPPARIGKEQRTLATAQAEAALWGLPTGDLGELPMQVPMDRKVWAPAPPNAEDERDAAAAIEAAYAAGILPGILSIEAESTACCSATDISDTPAHALHLPSGELPMVTRPVW